MRIDGTGARIGAIVALFALAGLLFALGQWQLQRGEDAQARLERFASAQIDAPLHSPPDDRAVDAQRYRAARLRGSYRPDRQLLLDNMVHDGNVGYHVLTPFHAAGEDRWLLVNRGFVAANPDRSVLPDVRVDEAPRDLAGRVDLLPQPGIVLGDSRVNREQHGVLVVSYPSAADAASLLGHPIFGYQLLLDGTEPDGYVREWRVGGLAPERNFAYAGQWYLLALGAAAAALVIGVRLVRAGRCS
jgi:surfeit locus 1 family protein